MSNKKTHIYHITHIDNLKGMIAQNAIVAQCVMAEEPVDYCDIAHNTIQDRRAQTYVPCSPGGNLHDYVPFYFAPRSPMLYAIHRGNVANCTARQIDIVYLVSSAENVSEFNLEFVFTDGHAIMEISDFYNNLDNLDIIDWDIMNETYWADTDDDPDRKRRRQAEFLVYKKVPWETIEFIAVRSTPIKNKVENIIADDIKKHPVLVKSDWYY